MKVSCLFCCFFKYFLYIFFFDSGNYSDQSSKQFLKTWKFPVFFVVVLFFIYFFWQWKLLGSKFQTVLENMKVSCLCFFCVYVSSFFWGGGGGNSGKYSDQSSKQFLKTWKFPVFFVVVLFIYLFFLTVEITLIKVPNSSWKHESFLSLFLFCVCVFFWGGGDSGKYSDQSSKQFLKTWKFPVFFLFCFVLCFFFLQWKVLSKKRSDDKIPDITKCFLRSQWNHLLCFILFIDYWYNKISDIRSRIS